MCLSTSNDSFKLSNSFCWCCEIQTTPWSDHKDSTNAFSCLILFACMSCQQRNHCHRCHTLKDVFNQLQEPSARTIKHTIDNLVFNYLLIWHTSYQTIKNTLLFSLIPAHPTKPCVPRDECSSSFAMLSAANSLWIQIVIVCSIDAVAWHMLTTTNFEPLNSVYLFE